MSEPIILADQLSLTYPSPMGRRVGVGTKPEGLSFTVREGEIFGVIGPDGAGKTTLFRILCSLLKPQRGTARVAGYDVIREYRQLRNCIGYMPGTFSLYGDLTVEENLKFFAAIFGTTIEENYHLVADMYSQIEPFRDRLAKSLSGGMKQKLALSCALIHSPRVLFLDEPTTGIDPVSRVELWQMLHKLSGHGVTVVVSTAYMDEAEQCHRIAFMQQGDFISLETPRALEQNYPHPLYSVSGGDRLTLLRQLRQTPGVASVYAFGETFHVALRRGADPALLHRSGVTVTPISPTIEDAFLALSHPDNTK